MAKTEGIWSLVYWPAFAFLIVGGINAFLFAFGFNLVQALLGVSFWAKLVYWLIGISAVYFTIVELMHVLG